MPVLCLGLSHKTAPVEIRERMAFGQKDVGPAAREIAQLPGVREAVVLSTCNRMEIYAGLEEAASAPVAQQSLEQWLAQRFRLGTTVPQGSFFHHTSKEAGRHLFAVASGLDSMVLGETEIFGQVKDAYAAAHEAGATSRTLNKLFQTAFRVGKVVRNTTEIQRGATSVGAVAVELAEKVFGDLGDCQVLLLGAGEISRRTAQSLQSRGAKSIIVSNRSYDRAAEMAVEMNGRAVRFEDWPAEVENVDIVISSTAAPHTLIHVKDVEPVMKKRRGGRPLFIIDIAVPRDVEPAVNDLDDVYLYDIDTIEGIAAEGRQRRERELERCRQIIEENVGDCAVFLTDFPRSAGPSAASELPHPLS